jgi:hypothetical protein
MNFTFSPTTIPVGLGIAAEALGAGFTGWSHHHFHSDYDVAFFTATSLYEETIPLLIIAAVFPFAFVPWTFHVGGLYALPKIRGGILILLFYFLGLCIGSVFLVTA